MKSVSWKRKLWVTWTQSYFICIMIRDTTVHRLRRLQQTYDISKFYLLHVLRHTAGGELQFLSFLNLAFDGGEWLTAHPDCPTPVPHRRGDWMGCRASLDVIREVKKIVSPQSGVKPELFKPVAWSLYSLRYPRSSSALERNLKCVNHCTYKISSKLDVSQPESEDHDFFIFTTYKYLPLFIPICILSPTSNLSTPLNFSS